MEVRKGQAVFYEDVSKVVVLALAEMVRDRQVTEKWIQGKELAVVTDLAEDESDSLEVLLTSKSVFLLRSQVRRVADFSTMPATTTLPKGCVWRRKIQKVGSGICPQQPAKAVAAGSNRGEAVRTSGKPGESVEEMKAVAQVGKRQREDTRPPEPAQKAAKVERNEKAEKLRQDKGKREFQTPAKPAKIERPKKADQTEEKKVDILTVGKYPRLTSESAASLQRRITHLTEESARLMESLSPDDCIRQRLRDGIFAALLLSAAEQPHSLPEKQMLAIAIAVEEALFAQTGSSAGSTDYTKKARMILFNLKDPKNPDARRSLLVGEIPPEQLPTLESKDLASASLKRQRERKERELLAEKQIIEETQSKLIVKSHKGESVLDISGPKVRDNTSTNDVVARIDERKTIAPAMVSIGRFDQSLPRPERQQKPWVPEKVYEIARENAPEKVKDMLAKRVAQYLPPRQAQYVKDHPNLR